MNLNKRNARIAGLLYLMIIVFGIFAEFVVRSGHVVRNDATATANNIMANEWLFRFGFVCDIICQTSHFFLVLVLYMMFKPFSKNAVLVMVSCVLVSVSITFINLLHQFAAIELLSGADYLKVFTNEQLHSFVLLFLNLHMYGYAIAGVFFGLWLYPLGYLLCKSGYFPNILGIMLMVGCFGYLIDFIVNFLFPEYKVVTYPGLLIALIAEFSICFYLLIKGVKNQQFITT
jgi:hypothetical protein